MMYILEPRKPTYKIKNINYNIICKRLTSDDVVSYLKADDAQYDKCREESIQQKEVLCVA